MDAGKGKAVSDTVEVINIETPLKVEWEIHVEDALSTIGVCSLLIERLPAVPLPDQTESDIAAYMSALGTVSKVLSESLMLAITL